MALKRWVTYQYVKDGKIKWLDKARAMLSMWLSAVPPGRQIRIVFSLARAKRTLDQNAYYWAVLTHFAEDHGWDRAEDVHEFFKGMFLRKHYSLPNGVRCETVGSTTDLTTVGFGEYVDKCKYWCYHNADWTWPPPKHLGM